MSVVCISEYTLHVKALSHYANQVCQPVSITWSGRPHHGGHRASCVVRASCWHAAVVSMEAKMDSPSSKFLKWLAQSHYILINGRRYEGELRRAVWHHITTRGLPYVATAMQICKGTHRQVVRGSEWSVTCLHQVALALIWHILEPRVPNLTGDHSSCYVVTMIAIWRCTTYMYRHSSMTQT